MKNHLKTTLLSVAMLLVGGMAVGQNLDDVMVEMRLANDGYQLEPYLQKWKEQLAMDLQQRNEPLRRLTAKELIAQPRFWLNGSALYISNDVDEKGRSLVIGPYHPHQGRVYHLSLQGSVLAVKEIRGGTATFEQMGSWQLLVVRNAEKKAVDVFIATEQSDYEGQRMDNFRDTHAVYDGHYVTAGGEDCVFGMPQDFYGFKNDVTDPGLFFLWPMKKGRFEDLLAYGGGRVSHGEPGHGDMPGAGGAGALMGPMVWRTVPTADGVKVWVARDEKYVDRRPAFNGTMFTLTKIEGPYKGVPGKWGFASVRPLSTDMLERFQKSALLLMRKEIFARHGDTFKDPALQAYFDRQPWYKKNSKPVVLSDVERLNNQLIQAVEATKPDNMLNEVKFRFSGMAISPFDDVTLTRLKDNPKQARLVFGARGMGNDTTVTAAWLDEIAAIVKEEGIESFRGGSAFGDEKLLDGYHWELSLDYTEDFFTTSGRNAMPENPRPLQRLREYLAQKCELLLPK